jgi:hypothetical protein
MMPTPKPIIADRIRNIRLSTFGWVDHNFLHHGYLRRLSQEALLLYYFLITVADRWGVSFYDYERICQYLSLEADKYLAARRELCRCGLIAFDEGIYQVLALPGFISTGRVSNSAGSELAAGDRSRAAEHFRAIGQILKNFLKE